MYFLFFIFLKWPIIWPSADLPTSKSASTGGKVLVNERVLYRRPSVGKLFESDPLIWRRPKFNFVKCATIAHGSDLDRR